MVLLRNSFIANVCFPITLLAIGTEQISIGSLGLLDLLKAEKKSERIIPNKKTLERSDFEQIGIKYINHLEYKIDQNNIPKIPRTSLSLTDRKNLAKYQELILEGYEIPWVCEFIDNKIGYGIFAVEDIEESDLIAEYTGIVLDEEKIKEQNIPYDLTYAWTINAPAYFADPSEVKFCIDGKEAGNFTRYINHNYDPNVKAVAVYADDGWHMIYIACKSIKKGQQLLVDYGKAYWVGRNPEALHE